MHVSNQPRNVYFVGAHGTGKTTVLQALRKHLTTHLITEMYGHETEYPNFIEEVVREVMQRDGYTGEHVKMPSVGLELQKRTLMAQFKAEQALETKWFISDRSGIDPIIYARVFQGEQAAEELTRLSEWHVLRERMRHALVIVFEPGNERWLEVDGVRVICKDLEEWRAIGTAFCQALEDHGIQFAIMPRDLEDLNQRVLFVERLVGHYFT
ncbi:AAA domain-containing protein [Aspergillus avenaceus]|uniref:AAA domain-containing protein n=1 Tax=Aspergillus avenaceus TaxID=36643 RepID=A0A5N6TYF3_ASPAV|nr:AAA domain-containing protein [Aspergillus avenaceus]